MSKKNKQRRKSQNIWVIIEHDNILKMIIENCTVVPVACPVVEVLEMTNEEKQ